MTEQKNELTQFPKSLIVTDVNQPIVRDVLERQWLEWWNQAEDVE